MKNYKKIVSKINLFRLFEILCIVISLYLVAIRIYYIFSFNTNLEGVEFALVHFIQLICLKGYLYSDAAKFPFLLVVHAPLYYYFMTGIVKLFSINVIDDIRTIYIISRSISLLMLFANYVVLLKIIQIFIQNFKYKILLFLLFILFIPSHFYACRPDSLKVFFFMLFLYTILQSYQLKKNIYYILSFLFLFISVLFKQDVLVYGCVLYFIFFIRTRNLIYLISPVLLVAIIIILMYVYYLFSTINLFKELFLYNIQYDSNLTINLLLIVSHYIKAIPLFIFSILNLKSKKSSTVILATISILYFFLFTLFMMRTGSSLNYTYETVILMLINTFIYVDESQLKINLSIAVIYIIMLLSINDFVFYNFKFPFYKYHLQKEADENYKKSYYNNLTTSKIVKQIIDNQVVFIPDMKYYLFYPDAKLIYGADWHYDRYCYVALNIKIDPKFIRSNIVAKYDNQFTNGNVNYILIEDNYKSKNLLKKYYTSFKPYKQVNNILIYKLAIIATDDRANNQIAENQTK